MKVEFRKAFAKDLKNIIDKNLLQKIKQLIEEVENIVETTEENKMPEIQNFKKMSGYSDSYRIRLGDYRIGITIEYNEDEKTEILWFERFLHRKDIYKYFPK